MAIIETHFDRARFLLAKAEHETAVNRVVTPETHLALAELLPHLQPDERVLVTETLFEIGARDPKRLSKLGLSTADPAEFGIYSAAGADFVLGEPCGAAERAVVKGLISSFANDGTLGSDDRYAKSELTQLKEAVGALLVVSDRPHEDLAWVQRAIAPLTVDARHLGMAMRRLEATARARVELMRAPAGSLAERKAVADALTGIIKDGVLSTDDRYITSELTGALRLVGELIASSSTPAADADWIKRTLATLKHDDDNKVLKAFAGLDRAARAREHLLRRPHAAHLPEREQLYRVLNDALKDGALDTSNTLRNELSQVKTLAMVVVGKSDRPMADFEWVRDTVTALSADDEIVGPVLDDLRRAAQSAETLLTE